MEPLAADRAAWPQRRPALWTVVGVGLVVGLANVAKPVHIDDTLYLTIARWIVAHPLDPYGGTLNWQQFPEQTYKVSISPPLLSYVFALVISVAGENVWVLHLAMVPWVLLACWALYRLGERFAGAGMATALLVLLGPAVLAGMNLMLDVPLLACICAAVECLLRGVERRYPGWYLAAALIGAAGVLIKFPALALVPVFLVVALQRRRWGPLLAAVGPVAALVAWQLLSRLLYGSAQVEMGLSFLDQFRASLVRQVVERTLSMFAITAWTLPIWVLAPSTLNRRGVVLAGSMSVMTVLIAAALLGPQWWQRPGLSVALLLGVSLGSFSFLACTLPSLPAARPPAATDSDDPRPLLWAWILGSLAIIIPFAPFVAVRSFLPIHPPLVFLLLSRRPLRKGPLVSAIGLAAVLGTGLAIADFHWAACYPATVRRLAADLGATRRPIVFLGHWGWQYYAEHAGFQPWDARWRDPPAGAILIIPLRVDRQWIHPEAVRRLQVRQRIEIPGAPLGLTTWNRVLGVRFYGGDYGELPWGVTDEPAERFFVSEVGPPVPTSSIEPALVR